MSSLFASLNTASQALDVLGQAIGVVQNNVSNASTPGFVTQTLITSARPFDPAGNLWGGVEANGVQSARNVFAEQAVWGANEQAGLSSQQASSLSSLQNFFDVSGTAGLPGALSGLYSAFSAWGSNPTDSTSRQQVITAARNLAQSIQQTAGNVEQLRSQTNDQIAGTVGSVNSLTSQIASINSEIQHGDRNDAGVQAQLYNSIEQLSNLVPISEMTASDGTATVLLGGQSPLVLGTTSNTLKLNYAVSQNPTYAGASPDAQIVNPDGQDLTSLVGQGTLGGLLNFRNTTLPSVIGDSQQQGSLNQLSQGIADTVNGLLQGGQISSGPPAVSGQALFSYSTTSPTQAASSLTLDPAISAATLAAIAPGPPAVANGIATALANLSNNPNSALSNLTFTQYYSSIAAGIGQSQATATASQQTQAQLLTQAQNMRAQLEGISLNQQAALLLQYQQSYQAAARIISTVNATIQSLLAVMQQIQ